MIKKRNVAFLSGLFASLLIGLNTDAPNIEFVTHNNTAVESVNLTNNSELVDIVDRNSNKEELVEISEHDSGEDELVEILDIDSNLTDISSHYDSNQQNVELDLGQLFDIQTEELNNIKVTDEEPAITPDNMFITVNTNTSTQEYVDGEITVNNAGDFVLDEETKAEVINIIKRQGKTISFYITDPETNTTISYNAQTSIKPASSIKAGVSLLTCKMVDTGQLSFDDEVIYLSKFYTEGSGTIQYDPVGTKYTIRELVHRCINVSDNIAYKMLLDIVTRDSYNDMVTSLGGTHLLASWESFGLMCAEDLNLIWQEIYNSDREQGEEIFAKKQNGEEVDESQYSACSVLYYELLDAKYNFLEDALPYESSHKSGFSGGTMNDSGVVYTDQGKLIVSIMTGGSNYNNTGVFNNVGGAVDTIIQEYCSYKAKSVDQELTIAD